MCVAVCVVISLSPSLHEHYDVLRNVNDIHVHSGVSTIPTTSEFRMARTRFVRHYVQSTVLAIARRHAHWTQMQCVEIHVQWRHYDSNNQ